MASRDLTRSAPYAQSFCVYSAPWDTLSAVQHVRRLNGGTQAHLMLASDGNLYAVKFQNNPHSARALASEFLATRLGLWLGLPMAQVEVIEVPERLVDHALLRIENDDRLTRCASGRQLAVRYLPSALHSLSAKSFPHVINRDDLIRVLAFDKWTGNADDRQVVFERQDKDEYWMTFIDQHNCFNAGRWTFRDLPHHGTYAHKHVYCDVAGWQSFEPTLSRIEKLSKFDLWKLATEIPPEWYQHETLALSRLIERLYQRRTGIRDLIAGLYKSDRRLFPCWIAVEPRKSARKR